MAEAHAELWQVPGLGPTWGLARKLSKTITVALISGSLAGCAPPRLQVEFNPKRLLVDLKAVGFALPSDPSCRQLLLATWQRVARDRAGEVARGRLWLTSPELAADFLRLGVGLSESSRAVVDRQPAKEGSVQLQKQGFQLHGSFPERVG